MDTVYMHMYLRAHGEELTKDSATEWMTVLSLTVFYKLTTNALDNIGKLTKDGNNKYTCMKPVSIVS